MMKKMKKHILFKLLRFKDELRVTEYMHHDDFGEIVKTMGEEAKNIFKPYYSISKIKITLMGFLTYNPAGQLFSHPYICNINNTEDEPILIICNAVYESNILGKFLNPNIRFQIGAVQTLEEAAIYKRIWLNENHLQNK
jgi:hypothetical protein